MTTKHEHPTVKPNWQDPASGQGMLDTDYDEQLDARIELRLRIERDRLSVRSMEGS